MVITYYRSRQNIDRGNLQLEENTLGFVANRMYSTFFNFHANYFMQRSIAKVFHFFL